jgi:Family of unknown function (DUF6920)
MELDFAQLPTPVARYFRHVMPQEPGRIKSAHLLQTGEFRNIKTNRWSSFEAWEYFSDQPRGFIWEARIQVAPLITVRVRDSYLNGKASMQAKMLSLIRIVNLQDKPELNAGALQRYLAEAVWFPTALLPSETVSWYSIDDQSATVKLKDCSTEVSLIFRFNDAGEVIEVFTPGRYREVNGNYELTPWCGYFSNYQERSGIRIPLEGYVEWQLPGENHAYWKGRIVQLEFVFSK